MKITIEQKTLSAGLTKVIGIIEKKATMPILANVHMSASNGVLTFRATDLDVEAVTNVDCDVAQDGVATVPADLLINIVKKYKTSQTVSMVVDDQKMTISQGRAVFNLATSPAADYPKLGDDDYAATFEMQSDDLARMFGKVSFAMSSEETRYYLQGVYFHPCEKGISTVATDGHRLAQTWIDQQEDFTGVIVPRKTVAELKKVLGSDPVNVSVSAFKIRFDMGDTVITSKVIDGTFPDYIRVIPTGNNDSFTVDAASFSGAASMVAMVSEDKQARRVGVEVSSGSVRLSVSGAQNNAEDFIDAVVSGPDAVMGFNSRYLADALAQADGGDVVLNYNGADPMSPALITATDDERFLAVVMPMRR